MATAAAISLVRITIKAPRRLIDVALPADVPAAELLPYILRHAGEDAADAGERHAGWLLRRPTGESLDAQRSLGALGVLDGELLHLVPGEVEWPELEYEDLVETIASGARRYGRSWGRAATRRSGLVVAAVVLVGGGLLTPLFQPPWTLPGLALFGTGVLLLAVGVLMARAVPDAYAGAVFAGASLPYAFLGGLLITLPDHIDGGTGLLRIGAAQVLLASTALLAFGVAGFVGVSALGRIFAAAMVTGALGMVGALFARPLAADSAAALVLVVGIGLLPAFPMLAIRLGRLPLPTLPQRSADLFTDESPPPAPDVFQAAARTDEVLSGLLTGLAVVGVAGVALLAGGGGLARQMMLGAVSLALLLRARLFPIPRQRVPLLAAGTVAIAVLTGVRAAETSGNGGLVALLLVVVAAGLGVAAAGLLYSRKAPSPYLGRLGDIVEVVAVLALVPLAAYLTGLFGYVQDLMAGLG